MPYFLKGNCVWKGTKEDPGEEVKCHADHAAALAHMKALYASTEEEDKTTVKTEDNTEDKGGPGSGWHGPAEGTHTAENAPNFAGGPGADRKYGAEDEPEEGQKHCKCTKCGSTFTLPKGKQCQDVPCPGCGGSAEQTSPRKDKPAEGEEGGSGTGGRKKAVDEAPCPACEEAKAMDAPGPTVHGSGGSMGEVASVMDDGTSDGCTCPKCGKGIPCTAKACPYCKESIDRVERGDTDAKATFTSYKSADGAWRWLSLSNWAVVDKESEIVSEQAYKDAIEHAQKSGDWGELDLVHVNGTDVGDCDTLFILKGGDSPAKFGAGGTWLDTAKATSAREAIQAEPDYWGVSLKFRYNPQRLVRGVYTGDIQVLKHSILPQAMAASYGTGIAVQGGNVSKALDEKAAEALRKLGHTEDEVAALAEKQTAAPAEENVVEKEESTQAIPERATLWAQLGKWFGVETKEVAPAASLPEEAESKDEVVPASAAQPAEKQAEDEPLVEKAETETPDAGALMRVMGEVVAKRVGEMVKEELDVRDMRIAALEQQIKGLSASVEEKVEQRLRDLPQVVKVAASQVAATAVEEQTKGLTFGRPTEEADKWNQQFVADVVGLVKDKMAGAKFEM